MPPDDVPPDGVASEAPGVSAGPATADGGRSPPTTLGPAPGLVTCPCTAAPEDPAVDGPGAAEVGEAAGVARGDGVGEAAALRAASAAAALAASAAWAAAWAAAALAAAAAASAAARASRSASARRRALLLSSGSGRADGLATPGTAKTGTPAAHEVHGSSAWADDTDTSPLAATATTTSGPTRRR